MAPLTREPETTGQTNAAGPASAKLQPVAMEIPVTVNGASTVAGSEKREPFSETTQTVLVFDSGAVIRLAAAVGPGQLLFVTNEKSKQEVVCQVVKTKQNGSTGGYVELKFTEATTDFWGIRTLGNGSGGSVATAGSIAGVPVKSLEQKLADLKTATPAATQITPPPIVPPAAPTPVLSASPVVAIDPTPIPAAVAPVNEIPAAPDVPAQPPPSRVPTLSEFLTHGSNGPELKAPEKAPPGKDGNREATLAAGLTEEKPVPVSTVPSQGSARDDHKPSLSAALGVSQSVAPGAASFDLSADLPTEEVKIPAWLEPLARNASMTENKPAEGRLAEAKLPVLANAGALQSEEAFVTATVSADVAQDVEAVPALATEGRSPNFGTALSLGSQTEGAASSAKGWKIGLAIAALLLAAAAIWYWYVNQPARVSAGGSSTVAGANPESIPAPTPNTPTAEPVRASTVDPTANRPVESAPISLPMASTASSTRPVGNSSALVKDTSIVSTYDAPVESAKKPALGEVRLAAPKVMRSNQVEENGAADPALALNGVTAADSSSLSMLTNKSKGPAAPLPVGGDVKVARLLSSVPPVYPQIARTQRVSGDVTIDALIDVSGHVSTMRVISGPALLHEAAMSAVKQWKYQPATLNNVPTATHLTVTVQFRLQ
jgi:TonB family protein